MDLELVALGGRILSRLEGCGNPLGQRDIPDSLIGVPENWTPDQIASYQKYWDAYFDGDLGRRRRAKFVPGGVAKTFVQTREPDLKGPFDEWLARIICFAFSISPQALTQQMNRATAETQKEMSEEEGLAPILLWVKSLIDDIIAEEFGSPDLEFCWSTDSSIDPQTQEAILSSYATKGILTINEARVALGREPLTEAAANRPMVLTAAGYVPLGQEAPQKGVKARIGFDAIELDKDGDWDEDAHPRWPAGSSDHQGGRFQPKGEDGSSTGQTALVDDCDQEWESARKFCADLLALHPFHPGRVLLGGHKTVDGCAKGFVSERCGANKV